MMELREPHDTSKVLGSVHLDVPDELLQDPIRNGSSRKEHGFNPWNEAQKTRIADHLEPITRKLLDQAREAMPFSAPPVGARSVSSDRDELGIA